MCRKSKNWTDYHPCFLLPIDGSNSLSILSLIEQVRRSRIPAEFKNKGIFALSFALSEYEICTKKAVDWENIWSPWNVALPPSTAMPGKHRQVNEQIWPRAQRWGREVFFCLRMIKSKSGTILGFNWEEIEEPWKKSMEHEDSRSAGEVLDSQGAMTVHFVEEQSHTVDCPLGRSNFLIFV